MSWYNDTKEKLDEIVLTSFNNYQGHGWDENAITASIIRCLSESPPKEVNLPWNVLLTDWAIYKYSGSLEQSFGDVAVICRRHFSTNQYIEGAAFYEAKRFYFDHNCYKTLKPSRLKAFETYSHAHKILMYDCAMTDDSSKHSAPKVRCAPTSHVLAMQSNCRSITSDAEDFLYSLAYRNLLGYELDFNVDRVNDAKGFTSNTGKKFSYIVAMASTANPAIQLEFDFVNEAEYSPVFYPKVDAGQDYDGFKHS